MFLLAFLFFHHFYSIPDEIQAVHLRTETFVATEAVARNIDDEGGDYMPYLAGRDWMVLLYEADNLQLWEACRFSVK